MSDDPNELTQKGNFFQGNPPSSTVDYNLVKAPVVTVDLLDFGAAPNQSSIPYNTAQKIMNKSIFKYIPMNANLFISAKLV